MRLTFHAFAASARPVSDAFWQEIQTACDPVPARSSCIEFGEGYLLEMRPDGFYPHAWWYSPVQKATLSEAIETLWEWRQEWTDPEGNHPNYC